MQSFLRSQRVNLQKSQIIVPSFLFHRYWDLPTKIVVNKIRTDSKCSQSGVRTTKFHREKLSFVQSATRTTKFH